jgi:16S rRNA G527 N7-methylase RsmG
VERLVIYSEVLDRWQRVQRLVGWRKPQPFLEEGIRDAWAAHEALEEGAVGTVVDLGSGAGLPALVLAAAGTRVVHLVEVKRKRAAFLREAARAMGLTNAFVHHEDAGQLRGSIEPAPDVLTARAFAAPDAVLEEAAAWGARACLLSTSRAKLREAGIAGGLVTDRQATRETVSGCICCSHATRVRPPRPRSSIGYPGPGSS